MPSFASNASTVEERDTKKNKLWTRRIVFAFFIFVGLVVLLESPLTRIRHIVVTGQGTVPKSVVADSGLRTGMSLWQVNGGSIQHQITTSEPLVQHVSVHTDYMSGTVTLGIKEKSEVAVFKQEGQLYSLLNDGTVYQTVKPGTLETLPIVQSVNAQFQAKVGTVAELPGLVQLCKQLGQAGPGKLKEVSQIVLNQYGDATMYMENGFAVQTGATQVASTLTDIGDVIRYFTSQGFGPGLIDMTGQPPYRYTPFETATQSKKGK